MSNNEREGINLYLKNRIQPLLEPLQFEILHKQPESIVDFSIKWLENYDDNLDNEIYQSDSEEIPDEIFKEKLNRYQRLKARQGISGQIYSSLKQEQSQSEKRHEPNRLIVSIQLRQCLFFKNLSQEKIEALVDSMKKVEFAAGEVVIRQGDIGQALYMVESGEFKCEIEGKNEIEKIYKNNEVFGELSLLYNTKRASTITAQKDGQLWSLNRSKFNQILRNSILCRKHLCEDLFKSEVFSALSEDEKEKFLDNLKEIEIKPNTYIIKEGQIGDRFFIVLDGSLVVEKMDANDFIKPVYEKGDYFGEIALIRNVPRQASVKALTTTKLAYIERSTFKRILGSLEEILKRNQSRYREIKRGVIRKDTY